MALTRTSSSGPCCTHRGDLLSGVNRRTSCRPTTTPDVNHRGVAGTLAIMLLLVASGTAAPAPSSPLVNPGQGQRVRRSQITLNPHAPCQDPQQFVTSMSLTQTELLNYIDSLLNVTLEFMSSANAKANDIISELGTICTSEMQPLLPIPTGDKLRGLNTTAALEESYRLIVVHANTTASLRNAAAPHPRHPGPILRDMADHLQSVMCHTLHVARLMGLTPNFQEAANLGLQDQRRQDMSEGSVQLVKSCQLAKSVATLAQTFSTYIAHLKSVIWTP